MRVAVNALAATRGGAVATLRPFLAALQELEPDWQFIVYVTNPDPALSLDGVTTALVRGGRWRRVWLELVALERRARKDGADLMLNLLNSGSLAPHLPSISWQRNALYFDRRWLGHQRLRVRLEAALRRDVALLVCRASAITVAPSQAMADCVRDWPLGRRLRVEVIPHGVEVERFAVAQDRRPDDWFTIGVIGHAAPHRGLVSAVRVLHEVRGQGVNARLLLTVPRYGNLAFQRSINEVAQEAELLDMSDHVVFGGAADDPVRWYSNLDLLLIPSECESFCLPLLEGLAAGVPVVTSGLPVLHELAGDVALHGRTHLEMAAQVLRIYGETERHRILRRELALKRAGAFSWGATAARVGTLAVETAGSACS